VNKNVRKEETVPDTTQTPATRDYARLGFVANPFASPKGSGGDDPYWMRLVTRAASNRLLAATLRARRRSCPVLVTMADEVPEYYYRVSQNDFLARTASDADLGIVALNTPLEMMRLGRIRGTLAEVAEMVVAVDFPATVGAWFASALTAPGPDLPERALLAEEKLDDAAAAFAADASGAVRRYLGLPSDTLTDAEVDTVVHEAYLRQVGLQVDLDKVQEGSDQPGADMASMMASPSAELPEGEVERDADTDMREYLLALVRTRLSAVIARALAGYASYGESLAAQEMKVTKAPRKTLAALLKMMSSRWETVAIMYDGFESWSRLDQPTKVNVLSSLMELRWIIGESGVMVVGVVSGRTPEIEEQFAAGEHVDWTMPELVPMYGGDVVLDPVRVQDWLDAASTEGSARLRFDSAVLAPLVAASENDILVFCAMAHTAFEDAAARGADALDDTAVAAGLATRMMEAAL
jgi:hypothetical protein